MFSVVRVLVRLPLDDLREIEWLLRAARAEIEERECVRNLLTRLGISRTTTDALILNLDLLVKVDGDERLSRREGLLAGVAGVLGGSHEVSLSLLLFSTFHEAGGVSRVLTRKPPSPVRGGSGSLLHLLK